MFRDLLTEGMLVIDFGAHMGYYTLIAAKAVGKRGQVYAFEPNPVNFKILQNNIRKNGCTNVTPLPKAVSNVNGKADFYVDAAGSDTGSITKSVVKVEKERIKVECVTLDDFMDSEHLQAGADLIKIDAEGAEGMIVQGASMTLRRSHLKILMEFVPVALRKSGTDPLQLLRTLTNCGFVTKLIDVRSSTLDLKELTAVDLEGLSENTNHKGTAVMNLLLEK